MEALNTGLVEDATRIPAPTKVVDALRRIIAEDFSELDITPQEIDRLARYVDGEIEIDLEYAPGSRARFVRDRHGRAHVQYWTRRFDGGSVLEGDWPVNPDDAETTARAIWYLVAQTHFALA
ncbi:hypothetical protein GS894_23855 [Rhodococcus hoagii]|nr:hypothetical protein [Prescottella equi]NKT12016.1 hypothetical protein [Prescottella equi]NKT16264.1 hypothetical protein [Prescottella equi]NKT36047.1 hypothetical protein [Prescottella equi]NKT37661.1 hypothetical protein [Prescottella equi]